MDSHVTKKSLIVGAGGFLGKALTEHLLTSGNSVCLTDLVKITGFPKVKAYQGDLEDKTFCKKMLKDIDTVFYLAAYKKNIAVHTERPFDVLLKNVRPFLNFLEAARGTGVKNIVYISSTNVEYISDTDARIDGYVYGKYINEIIAKSFVAETGIQVKVVRSAAIYGPGDNFNPATANFIPSIMRRVDEAQGEIMVWGKGKRKLQYIYIDDLAKNIIASVGDQRTFFTFGNEETLTVNDIVKKVIGLMDKKLKIAHDLTKPDKPTKRIQFQNCVKPAVDMDTGLRRTLAYYKKLHA